MHVEWGPAAAATAPVGAVAVVIDVLSFSTTVSVAADLGIEVLPHPMDGDAAGLAARERAVLAAPRGAGSLTLSPVSLRADSPVPPRLVLPSPNGSTLAHQLSNSGATVVAGCLRNAAAVAAWIRVHHPGSDVHLVAAGERWSDDTLRPAVEDLWGAGAVATHLPEDTWHRTPEAHAAAAAWHAAATVIDTELAASTSGQELSEAGFAGDVAAEVDSTDRVPVLLGGRFRVGPVN